MADLRSRREVVLTMIPSWLAGVASAIATLSATSVVTPLIGCSSKPAPLAKSPSRRHATPFLTPDELLPSDAGVIVRIDRQRVKAASRLAPVELALQRALRSVSALRKLLQGAETMWIALREIPLSGEVDGVLAMTADLRAFDATRLATEGGGGWTDVGSGEPGVIVYQTNGATARSAPSLLVVLRSQLMLLATPLEADGVLKVLRGGATNAHKEIPADAALAFSLSAPSLRGEFAQRFPGIARLLRGSSLIGTLDVSAGDVDEVRLDIVVKSPSQERSARVQKLVETLLAEMAESKTPAVAALAKGATLPRTSPTELRVLCRAPGVDIASLVDAFSDAPPVLHDAPATPNPSSSPVPSGSIPRE